ncbi:hypothetical protein K525DRAFT_200991 [Schizophyllum commune Loenen D]|nr:hypothetical protein K525DRAFT_200991 [Schizophyllum commune Loenen D]
MAYRQTLPLFALTGGSALIALGTCFLRPCLDSPDTGSLYSVPPAIEISSTFDMPLDTSSAQNIHQIPSFSNYAQPSTDSYGNHLTIAVVQQVPIHALQCSPSEAPLPNYFLPEYCVLPPPSSASISASTLSSSVLIIAFCLSLLCGWVAFSFRCRITAIFFKMTAALAFKGYLSLVLYDDLLDEWTDAQVPRAIMSDNKSPVKRSSPQSLPSLMVSNFDVNCPLPAPPFRNLGGSFSASSDVARSLQDTVAEDLDDIPNGRFTVIHPPRYATRRATDGDCRYQAYKRVYIGAEPEVGQDRQDGLADESAHVPYRTTTFGPREKDDGPSLTESHVVGASRPPLLLLANVLPMGLGSEEADPLSTSSAPSSRPSRRSSLSVSFSDELKYRILSPINDNGVDRFASGSLSSPFLGSILAQDEKLSPLPRRRSTDLRTGQSFRDVRRSTAVLDASRSAASRYTSRSTTAPDAVRSTAVRDDSRAMPHRRSLDSDEWERSSTSSRASSMVSRINNISSRTSSQSLSRSFGRLSLDSDDWERTSVSSRASSRSVSSTVSRSSSRAGTRLSTLAASRLDRGPSASSRDSPRSSTSSSSRYSSSSRTSSRASSPSASDTESLRSLNDESLLPYDNERLLSDHGKDLPFASPSTPTPARSRTSIKRWQRAEAGWPKEDPEDEDMEPMTADGQFNMAWWHKRKEAENRLSTPSVISVVG